MRWIALLLITAGASTLRAAEPGSPLKSDAELVCDLGSRDYRTREAATAELKKRPEAYELVREASRSSNPAA